MTGFRGRNDPPLPGLEVRRFRGACHAAALTAGGTVESLDEAAYPRGYHCAVVAGAGILCHAGYPLIAFVADSAASWLEPRVFVEPPGWAGAFAERGFTVLGRELLESPLTAVDTSALTRAEWRQIHGWKATAVGETVFNGWD